MSDQHGPKSLPSLIPHAVALYRHPWIRWVLLGALGLCGTYFKGWVVGWDASKARSDEVKILREQVGTLATKLATHDAELDAVTESVVAVEDATRKNNEMITGDHGVLNRLAGYDVRVEELWRIVVVIKAPAGKEKVYVAAYDKLLRQEHEAPQKAADRVLGLSRPPGR